MDEAYIECAEKTTQDIIEIKLEAIRYQVSKLDVVGSGSCVVCGKEARKAEYKGEMIFTRFCSDDCRDEFDGK
jgi:hypothetical protein